jgi:opacity protein-like surface antigen
MQRYLAALGWLAAMAGACPLMAADLSSVVEPVPAESLWKGSLSVYGWYATVLGDVGINGLGPVSITEDSSSDTSIFDILQGVLMASGELRYGAVGVFGDFIWVDLGQSKTSKRGHFEGSAEVSTIIGTGAVTYAVVDTPQLTLQGLAGARVWSVDGEVKLSTTGEREWDAKAASTIEWVDPLFGVRGRYALSPNWFLSGTAVVGGFGVGSKLMWDVFAGLGYSFTENISMSLGYRGLGVDYANNGDIIDVTAHGPLAGLTIRF